MRIVAGGCVGQLLVRSHVVVLVAEAVEALHPPAAAVTVFGTRCMHSLSPFCGGLPGWIRSKPMPLRHAASLLSVAAPVEAHGLPL